jgi:acyl-CoA thioester hydrolase
LESCPLTRAPTGGILVAVQHEATYKPELFAGDLIMSCSRILEICEKIIRLYHKMLNAENAAVAVTTMLAGVHLTSFTANRAHFQSTFSSADAV